MGSVEELWDDATDRLFDFDLEGQKVEFECIPFARHGASENWLDSDSFNYLSSYPVAAKKAIDRANKFMRDHPDPKEAPADRAGEIQTMLLHALGGGDEYWPLWIPYYHQTEILGNDSRQ
jgi:hypothetical protein